MVLGRGLIRPSILLVLLGLVACGGTPSPVERPDILLVTIDTLRADRVGAYGHADARTPTLDALAAGGTRYVTCQSVAPITLVSHASILTGRWPTGHGVRNNGSYRLGEELPTVAERLSDAGYRTGAFVAALPLTRRFGLDRGFDHYDDVLPPAGEGFHLAERPASEVNAALLRWLEPGDDPVFAWAHYFEPHFPYDPPAAHRAGDPYDGEVATADAALGQLLGDWEVRRSRPLIVVVTSDHGEGLGEHGEDSHTLFVYQTTQRVPLIVHGPGIPVRVEEEPVSLVDLAPTLLRWAGAQGFGTDGVDLMTDPLPRRDLYAETLAPLESYGWSPAFALVSGDRKVIRSARPRAFDLADDPAELRDRSGEEWTGPLLARLDAMVTASGVDAVGRTPSAAEREALAALGYAGGVPASDPGRLLEEVASRPDATDRFDAFRDLARAEGELNAGRPAAALRILDELLAQDPEGFWPRYRQGEAHLALGDVDRALSSFREAASRRRAWPEIHVRVARLHRAREEWESAAASYRLALEVGASPGEAGLELAEVLGVLGREDQRRELLSQPVSDPWARRRLAQEASRTVDPSAWPAIARARTALRDGDWDGVLAALGPLDDPGPVEAEWLRAYASYFRGDVEGSVAAARRVLARDDAWPEAHNLLAWILATRGDPATALPHALRAVELFPEEPEYHDTLIEVYLRAGESAAARAHLEGLPAELLSHPGLAARVQNGE